MKHLQSSGPCSVRSPIDLQSRTQTAGKGQPQKAAFRQRGHVRDMFQQMHKCRKISNRAMHRASRTPRN